MRIVMWLWEDLQRMGRPYLCDDVELEAWLALLDFYMTPYIEEFIDRQGKLTPDSIVHLRNCKQRLAPLLKQLDGWEHSYFEQLLLLSREVLKRIKVKEACQIVIREAKRREVYPSDSDCADSPDVCFDTSGGPLATVQR